ncbi:hypothetical protein [Bathymodiolus thermophilus thioautotrophic gill symbiont]|uniref:Uncharacterized protein n=1 Tax=Bathymodiolus thermophilus thioautotrophic gill symbiont TaxID=2360 RepID=A0A8H9CF42_9GAMM|nr:hypothetical protein [Bathymodiolus thermophilus thioautotrophic gill symbiont]CAB5494569.1 hypothetical protein THERMOS_135 [Bathymodiolus thermophilus thioautotrophic gill symbiont]
MIRIICEGLDDKKFIIQLLQHLEENGELNAKPEYAKYIEVTNGKSDLLKSETHLGATQEITAGKIKKILFVFDADFIADNKCNGLENSQKCIEDLIQKLGWNITTDYHIFDKNLDDFILKTLDNKADFEACEQCFELKKLNKNRKILTCIYQKLYPTKPYDFSHPNFNELKQKLITLFKK